MNGLVFDAERHVYLLNGRVIPSVTQILTAEGIINGQWYTVDGRVRGEHVHLALRYHDESRLDEATVSDEIRPYLDAWQRFLADTGFVALEIERPFVNEALRYAGTPDRVGWLGDDKTVSVIDIKTGRPEPWHALQTAAYAYGIGKRLAKRIGVYLRANGTYRIVQYLELDDIGAWHGIVAAYNWKQKYLWRTS